MTRGIGWRDAAGAAFRVLPPASFESDWGSTGHDGGLREMWAKANGLSGACLSKGGAKQRGRGLVRSPSSARRLRDRGVAISTFSGECRRESSQSLCSLGEAVFSDGYGDPAVPTADGNALCVQLDGRIPVKQGPHVDHQLNLAPDPQVGPGFEQDAATADIHRVAGSPYVASGTAKAVFHVPPNAVTVGANSHLITLYCSTMEHLSTIDRQVQNSSTEVLGARSGPASAQCSHQRGEARDRR